MFKISGLKCLVIMFSALISTGCAHKKLIDAGENFNNQGRYELAVENYQNALSIEPDDAKTRKDLAFAQQQLDLWLDNILIQADIAKQKGLNGRALLLFSKLAKLRQDQYALNQYKQLHQQLADQARYTLAVNSPKGLGNALGQSLADVQVISQISKTKANHFSLQLDFSQPVFATRSTLHKRKQEYVSGIETVANPEYLQLQQEIVDTRQHIHQDVEEIDYHHQQLNDSRRATNILAKDLEIGQLKLANAAPNSSVYNHWQQQVSRLNKALSQAQQNVSNQRGELDELNLHFDKFERQLNKQLDTLSYLPPTAEQEVIDYYSYQVTEVTRTGSGQLKASFSDGVVKSKTVSASNSDEGHDEHPLIKLKHNPISLLSDKQLSAQYYQNTRKQAQQDIKNHLGDYRDNLKNKANQQPGIDDKFEAWVHYGLSGEHGVDRHTAGKMQNQLQQEFGIVGEFNINQLLYIFSH